MILDRHGAGYRWYVVILLLLIFILSYFDRFILSLLVEPIKEALKLSDFQIGLLLGPAFSLFHIIVAIPLGWYADRSNRKYLLIAGILLWCTMTAGSGLVATFLPLFLMRLGLGLGEAVVSPCSVSMISDYFDRKERPRAISVYMAGPYLGAGLAFLLGGFLVRELQELGHVTWPLFGTLAPWQATFVLVGIPGFIFAGLMMTVREPQRQEKTAIGRNGWYAFQYIFARWRGFGSLFVGSTCNFALSALTLWNVPLFSRVWGWGVAETGLVTGAFYFTAGPIGTAVAVWAHKQLGPKHVDASMRVLLLGLLICVPASALYPVMPTPEIAVIFMFIAFIGKSVATAGGPASMALITPGEIRTQSMAIFNTVISLIGPLLGPPIIGAATDLSGDPKNIGIVLTGYVILLGAPAILITWRGLTYYRQAAHDLDASLASSKG
ncbi:MFS family permease [Sphingomonas zeicaulis]|uniref:MFS transporter n=1 Tax=Sphingomonas zeicaulis TaxID=1632740 RepID=UPI003D2480A0